MPCMSSKVTTSCSEAEAHLLSIVILSLKVNLVWVKEDHYSSVEEVPGVQLMLNV